jgi:hypothetical protein
MDSGIPLFTGDKKVKWSTGYNKDLTITVKQDTVMPMTVLMLAPKMVVFE